jgi:succinate dehydrogenase hydrophobic anchor subunit
LQVFLFNNYSIWQDFISNPHNRDLLRCFALIGWYHEQNLMMEMIMSEVLISGEPKDYYKILTKNDNGEYYQANRRAIREMMKDINKVTGQYQYNGNLNSVILTHQDYYDAFEAFIINEPDDAKVAMRSMLAEEMKAKESELNVNDVSMLKGTGILLIIIGIAVCFYALTMSITAGRYDDVINAGLVADRQLYMTVGAAITIIGSLSTLFSLLLGKMGKRFIAR